MRFDFLVGVDEAGRGPLAGPLAVGVVVAHKSFAIKEMFPGVADSKILSEKKREEIYALLVKYARQGLLRYTVVYVASATIDRIGLTRATMRAVHGGVRKLAPEVAGYKVLLDGLLHAPAEYKQETIIRGDASEPIISLASIAAKVSRDRLDEAACQKIIRTTALKSTKGTALNCIAKILKSLGRATCTASLFFKVPLGVYNPFDHIKHQVYSPCGCSLFCVRGSLDARKLGRNTS